MPRIRSMALGGASRSIILCLTLAASCLVAGPAQAAWTFTDVTVSAGLAFNHDIDSLSTHDRQVTGGAACADYDGDGWLDLYALGGNASSNHLFRNNGNGTFTDLAAAAGVALPGTLHSGACFADWDSDGDPDLFVSGLEGVGINLYENNGDGTFTDVTVASGVTMTEDTWSGSFADFDRDGDLDMFACHRGISPQPTGHVWRNNGNGTFTDADVLVGYVNFPVPGVDNTLTYNFADINGDSWLDMLAASDHLTSHVYRNNGGTFSNVTNTNVIKDDNGMGNAVGDYDNDGDLDWFVSSIYCLPFVIGNRLYRNDNGVFSDATASAGVANGSWGWGATMQDFNNDGFLDIFHVNGWRIVSTCAYSPDACRMFRNNGNSTFSEIGASINVDDNNEGRGLVAFDPDRDGDLDLFLANNDGPAVYLRNDGLTANWLQVKLAGPPPNLDQVGARVRVTVGAVTQLRELRCGSNFLSNDPIEAHFGLGAAATVNTLQVTWTDGTVTTLNNVPANQRLLLTHPAVDAPMVGMPAGRGALELLGAAPNPFDGGTAIRFRLGEPSGVQVRVFDAAGRAVRTLSEATRAAGTQEVVWDGRDGRGSAVGSGVYWYEVRAGAQSARGKLVRLR